MTTERIDVQDDGRRCHCCGETLDRCRETYRGSTAPATAIDVLAVMDRLIGNTRTMAGLTGDPVMRDHLREGEEARDAVAELVEATQFAVRNVKTVQQVECDLEFGSVRKLGDVAKRLASAISPFGGAA